MFQNRIKLNFSEIKASSKAFNLVSLHICPLVIRLLLAVGTLQFENHCSWGSSGLEPWQQNAPHSITRPPDALTLGFQHPGL